MPSFFQQSPLKVSDKTPIYQQLYDYLRAAILSGQIPIGTQMPSTRALASELGVSRNTVLSAYDQLFAEGYLETVGGKGTFVTHTLPESMLRPPHPRRRAATQTSRQHHLSKRVTDLLNAPTMPSEPFARRLNQAFKGGIPALDQFPYDIWGRLVARHAHGLHPQIMIYQDAAGYRPLREAIAEHVLLARQVRCTPDQVIIVTGSQGGLYLTARVLLDPGDVAWMEDPGYIGAQRALAAAGAKLAFVPVDDEGFNLDAGIQQNPNARLVYLTPSHQFPLGVTLSLRRRLDLLAWARNHRAWLLEDDYDSEYRFAGRPLASLQGLDDSESVIYVGTFSKVMFPSLRLGYLIVPPGLVDAFLAYRSAIDYHHPLLEQAALADFISEGHFSRHIRRMRALYATRRGLLLDALRDSPLQLDASEAGMHLVGWLPPGISDQHAVQRAAEYDVSVAPVSAFATHANVPAGLMMGYSAVDEAEIRRGAEQLMRALDSLM